MEDFRRFRQWEPPTRAGHKINIAKSILDEMLEKARIGAAPIGSAGSTTPEHLKAPPPPEPKKPPGPVGILPLKDPKPTAAPKPKDPGGALFGPAPSPSQGPVGILPLKGSKPTAAPKPKDSGGALLGPKRPQRNLGGSQVSPRSGSLGPVPEPRKPQGPIGIIPKGKIPPAAPKPKDPGGALLGPSMPSKTPSNERSIFSQSGKPVLVGPNPAPLGTPKGARPSAPPNPDAPTLGTPEGAPPSSVPGAPNNGGENPTPETGGQASSPTKDKTSKEPERPITPGGSGRLAQIGSIMGAEAGGSSTGGTAGLQYGVPMASQALGEASLRGQQAKYQEQMQQHREAMKKQQSVGKSIDPRFISGTRTYVGR
jgi:hypothetical protein